MTALRLGVDVGGTNTDAVVVDEAGAVLVSHKVPTTPDPMDGIRAAMQSVLPEVDRASIRQVMLGTTHPANAIIQRRGLDRIGILRVAAPSSYAVRPGAAWPAELLAAILGPTAIIHGGFEYDGREIAPLDEDAVRRFAAECAGKVTAIAVSSPFSPASYSHEDRTAEILTEELGEGVASRSATRSARWVCSSGRTPRRSTRRCSASRVRWCRVSAGPSWTTALPSIPTSPRTTGRS